MLTPNKQSKSVLSRLMASENITVIHSQEARTASFDLRNRVLTLPVLGEMSDELYDMIVGHEVGHAIYTPYTEEDEKSIKAGKPLAAAVKIGGDDAILAMGYLNVVEDARIEKLMKEKFAGLRRDFHIGYKDLYDRDFFEVKTKNINEMGLIDRINLHFKVGSSVVGGIDFNEEEKNFVNEIENARTFDDVLDITQRLWDYCKEQRKKEEEQEKNVHQLDDIIAMLGMGADADGNPVENSDKTLEKQVGDKYSTKGLKPHECMTQNSLDNYMKKLHGTNENHSFFYQTIPSLKSNVIVNYKTIMDEYNRCLSNNPKNAKEYNLGEDDYRKFCNESKSTVNLLVKQFLMKKAAKDSRRSMIHRTGNLDTVRMMNYNFTDDIFLRNTIVKKGKSHGLTLFMDWSGSMHICFGDTMRQLFQVVLFCRRLNIPFEVYGFTSRVMHDYNENCWSYPADPRGKTYDFHDFRLLNILSSKMSSNDFNVMMRNLFVQVNQYENRRADSSNYVEVIPSSMELSSTPLNETVVAAIDIVKRFKAENKLDIVNAIFLTDGETTGCSMPWTNQYTTSNYIYGKQTYKLNYGKTSTDGLVEVFKDQTGCRAIGIFLESKKRGGMSQNTKFRYFGYGYDNHDKISEADKMFDKEGFALADHKHHGYDELFIIRGNSEIDDSDLDEVLAEKTTKVSIRNAFNKTLDNKLSSRVMLNRFIDLIAVD